METLKIKHFLPTEKQYKHMVEKEVTYFYKHNNTRFTVASRTIPRRGKWINLFRAAPYIYKWSKREEEILPEHYKQRCKDYMTREPIPVHWRPYSREFTVDADTGERIPLVNAPIPVIYPEESNKALWGGEGIIFGYYKDPNPKKKLRSPTLPRVWPPTIINQVFYSEILNQYMSINVTRRAQYLIDESFGLDNYILKTHEVDLCSRLGMNLKREMLLALARKSLYPDDPVKREKIYNKFKAFVIPEEEAEWVGLTVRDAVKKAQAIEAKENELNLKPLKDYYLVELIHRLQLDADQEKGAVFGKLHTATEEKTDKS